MASEETFFQTKGESALASIVELSRLRIRRSYCKDGVGLCSSRHHDLGHWFWPRSRPSPLIQPVPTLIVDVSEANGTTWCKTSVPSTFSFFQRTNSAYRLGNQLGLSSSHAALVPTGDGNIGTQADQIAGRSRRFQPVCVFIPAPYRIEIIAYVILEEELSTTLLVSPEIMKNSKGKRVQ